jgi:protein-disulfide isomerase
MPLPRLFAAAALLVLAPAVALAAPPKRAPAPVLVVATPQGSRLVGRPGAPLKLVEYVSYTCSHCAAFEKEGADTVAQDLIRPGKASLEYRPFLRNIVDVAATLMVGCGAPSRFPGNHAAVLRAQEKWLVPPSEAAQQRWQTGDFPTRMRAVAQDMNLYGLFQARGYARAELDRCLANEKLADAIAAENRQAIETLKIGGTPSFLINGKLQPAHDWATLRTALAAAQ